MQRMTMVAVVALHYEPWEQFEVGFLYDYNISHELAIWVRIAMVFKEFVKRHSSVNKRQLIGELCRLSAGTDQEIFAEFSPTDLRSGGGTSHLSQSVLRFRALPTTLAAARRMDELTGCDTQCRTHDRCHKIDPQRSHVARHNCRCQRASGIHRGTTNRTSEQGLEADHAADCNCCHESFLFGSAGHGQDHEHQHGRQYDLQHKGLPSSTGWNGGTEVVVREEYGPQHTAGCKSSCQLAQDIGHDRLPRKPFGEPEAEGHSGIEVRTGHIANGIDHGHDHQAERQATSTKAVYFPA